LNEQAVDERAGQSADRSGVPAAEKDGRKKQKPDTRGEDRVPQHIVNILNPQAGDDSATAIATREKTFIEFFNGQPISCQLE
jgi:hypothetical protein